MTRSIAYPAASHEQAESRARSEAEENGWCVVESEWHPHLGGGGGVLVVQISEPEQRGAGKRDSRRSPH
jgi:hypothetical protein